MAEANGALKTRQVQRFACCRAPDAVTRDWHVGD